MAACGFSLAEVLVALAVATMMAAVLTRYVAGIRFNAAQVRERVELWTISQSMLDGLSKTLSPGTAPDKLALIVGTGKLHPSHPTPRRERKLRGPRVLSKTTSAR